MGTRLATTNPEECSRSANNAGRNSGRRKHACPTTGRLFLSWTDGDPGDNRDWDEVLDAVARES